MCGIGQERRISLSHRLQLRWSPASLHAVVPQAATKGTMLRLTVGVPEEEGV